MLKRRDMHEHVATALRLNEAVSFCWIEPFKRTSSHSTLHRMLPGQIAGRTTLALRVSCLSDLADNSMCSALSAIGPKRTSRTLAR